MSVSTVANLLLQMNRLIEDRTATNVCLPLLEAERYFNFCNTFIDSFQNISHQYPMLTEIKKYCMCNNAVKN